MKNPAKIIALDLYNWKLQLGKDSGADVLLNPKQLDVVAKVKELSGGMRIFCWQWWRVVWLILPLLHPSACLHAVHEWGA